MQIKVYPNHWVFFFFLFCFVFFFLFFFFFFCCFFFLLFFFFFCFFVFFKSNIFTFSIVECMQIMQKSVGLVTWRQIFNKFDFFNFLKFSQYCNIVKH